MIIQLIKSVGLFVAVFALLSVSYEHFFEGKITYGWADLIESAILGLGVSALLIASIENWKRRQENKKP